MNRAILPVLSLNHRSGLSEIPGFDGGFQA